MAKVKMICPLSGNLCKDCAIYRGRHYFLCFVEEYRGRVDEPGEITKTSEALSPEMRSARKFEIPPDLPVKAYDAFRDTHRIAKAKAKTKKGG
jgi:hypothetical protein